MSAATLPATATGRAAPRAAVNPWVLAMVVTVPTFMEVLDTSIANVALRHIAGGLSAAANDSEWVITSYLAANAIVLPLSGWLSTMFGRRNYFLASVAMFTASSVFCGLATNLPMLIFARIVQGLAGGGLQPSTQGVLLDTFPPEKQGSAMAMFGVGVLIAPILGPTLGGWITDNYSWRWIFYINLPVGVVAFLLSYWLLEDPDYLKALRAERRGQPLRLDILGLGLLALGLGCLEVVLSKGQEWDWFGDPSGRVQILVVLLVVSLVGFVIRQLTTAHPVVNLRPLADRNFAVSSVIIFANYAVLYGALTSLPGMLQSLFGYDATNSGLVLSPSGFFALLMMPVVGFLLSRGVDARVLITCGLCLVSAGCYWMSQMNLFISPSQVVWPRVVQTMGTSVLFAPLNVAAYIYLPRELRGSAAGLYNLLRNEGGSVGTSAAKTLLQRREQFHTLRLGESLDPFNPNVAEALSSGQAQLQQRLGDPAYSEQLTYQILSDTRQQQSAALSYFDAFWVFAILALMLCPLVLLIRRSVAERGAHVAAE
ncbi:MAG: DHA2 family efflux MFS transporter permease subunit [Isosphaeraceae bacterium]